MRLTHAFPAFVLLAVACLAGCYESLHSVVTPDKLVFYEDLLGDYRGAGDTTGQLVLEKGPDRSYRFKAFDAKGGEIHRGAMRLIKLGDAHFYELTVDGLVTLDGKPRHVIGRLAIEGDAGAKTITGYTFESDDQLLSAVGVATSEITYKEGGEEKKGRALSMTADTLQPFLAAHAKEMTKATLKFQQSAKPK
jgi:hypothetical protein